MLSVYDINILGSVFFLFFVFVLCFLFLFFVLVFCLFFLDISSTYFFKSLNYDMNGI